MNKKYIYFRYYKLYQKHIVVFTKKNNLKSGTIFKQKYEIDSMERHRLIPKNFFRRLSNRIRKINKKQPNPIIQPDVISTKYLI